MHRTMTLRKSLHSFNLMMNDRVDAPAETYYAESTQRREYEYCPRCEANLTLQKGYDSTLSYWICRGCGEMLINPEVESDDDIAWICDRCEGMLNIQPRFNTDCGVWTCTECGFPNRIDATEVYISDEEYQTALRDPYRGLSDEDVLKLSEYQDEGYIDDRDDIILTRHIESGRQYIRKLLRTYNKSVYAYLRDHPVLQMPLIREYYESDNCLIVIEEYIAGRTVADILEDGPMDNERAVAVTVGICEILNRLHSLPRPIIHRDVKPSNVILTPDDKVYLLDVNAARWYDPDKNDDTKYMGTQNYAAPEQAGYGLSASSAKSDIYAVGVMLNVMLTGCFPKEKRANGAVWTVIEKCISLEAGDRYTADELIEALRDLSV